MENQLMIMPDFIQNLRCFIESIVRVELGKYEQTTQKENDEWLTIEEACKYLKVSKTTLWDMAKKGVICKFYIDAKPRFKKSEIDQAFLKVSYKKGGNYEIS